MSVRRAALDAAPYQVPDGIEADGAADNRIAHGSGIRGQALTR